MRKLNLYLWLCTILCVFTLSLNAKATKVLVPSKVTCPRDKSAILKAAKAQPIKKKKFKKIGSPKAPLIRETAPEAPIKPEPVKTEVIKPSTPVPSAQTKTEKVKTETVKEVSTTSAKDPSQQALAPGHKAPAPTVEKKS